MFFFRRPLEIFLRTLRLCTSYLKGSPKVVLYASKKNHGRTAHQYDYISGKVEKVWILKFEAQTWLEYYNKITFLK